jgi:hypothetical protein
MDKLYFYMLPKYLEEAENLAKKFLTNDNVMAMACPSTASLSSLRKDDYVGEDEDDYDDNIIDAEDILDGSEVEVDSDDDG